MLFLLYLCTFLFCWSFSRNPFFAALLATVISTIAPRVLDLETVEKRFLPPVVAPKVRIARERDGVAIWSSALFNDAPTQHLRLFLSRAFSLPEISAVEIDRRAGVGRVKYGLLEDAPSIWRKLKQVLTQSTAKHRDRDDEVRSEYRAAPFGIELLYLDGPVTWPIHIGRVGSYLSTWRLRYQTDDRVRLTHPILRNRKDVAYRLEEELTAILGVRESRTNTLASSVLVRFNPRRLVYGIAYESVVQPASGTLITHQDATAVQSHSITE